MSRIASPTENVPVAAAAAMERMRVHAAEAAALLRCLGNEQRLMVLCHLVEGEQGVGRGSVHRSGDGVR